jgi:hypothetical protein
VKALEYIASHEGVWLTTSDEIAAHYLQQSPPTKSSDQRKNRTTPRAQLV